MIRSRLNSSKLKIPAKGSWAGLGDASPGLPAARACAQPAILELRYRQSESLDENYPNGAEYFVHSLVLIRLPPPAENLRGARLEHPLHPLMMTIKMNPGQPVASSVSERSPARG